MPVIRVPIEMPMGFRFDSPNIQCSLGVKCDFIPDDAYHKLYTKDRKLLVVRLRQIIEQLQQESQKQFSFEEKDTETYINEIHDLYENFKAGWKSSVLPPSQLQINQSQPPPPPPPPPLQRTVQKVQVIPPQRTVIKVPTIQKWQASSMKIEDGWSPVKNSLGQNIIGHLYQDEKKQYVVLKISDKWPEGYTYIPNVTYIMIQRNA